MDNPNRIENFVPLSGQYSLKKDLRLNAWLAVATVVYIGALFLVKHHPEWSPVTRGLLKLSPLLPGLLYVRSWVRLVRGLDELQRGIQLEAFLIAALGTLLVELVITTLADTGGTLGDLSHGLGIGGVFIVMFPLWLLGWGIANCRYK